MVYIVAGPGGHEQGLLQRAGLLLRQLQRVRVRQPGDQSQDAAAGAESVQGDPLRQCPAPRPAPRLQHAALHAVPLPARLLRPAPRARARPVQVTQEETLPAGAV